MTVEMAERVAQAVTVLEPRTTRAPWAVLTVEHAEERIPEGFVWPQEDDWLRGTHWAVDLHIAPFARALAARIGAPTVLSRFSRLLVDPNRPLDSDTLFRRVAEGRLVHVNAFLDDAERARRLAALYHPYHAAADDLVARHPTASVLGLHSFTPEYEGQRRAVEIGVLFDDDEDIATAFHAALLRFGHDVRLNQPYSGRHGLMFGPQAHASRYGRPCLELELRQDLLADPAGRARLVEAVAAASEAVLAPLVGRRPEA